LFEFVIPVYDPVIRPIATSVSSLGSAVIAVKEIGAENRTSLFGQSSWKDCWLYYREQLLRPKEEKKAAKILLYIHFLGSVHGGYCQGGE
jgi:hypothetical protein